MTTQYLKPQIGGWRNRKRTVALAGVAFLLIVGTAVAAWFVLARGNGTAGVGSLSAPTVAMGPADHDLYPGGTGVGSFTITNPNTGALFITDARVSPVNAGIHSDNPLCEGGNYLAILTQPGLHIPVPVGQSVIKIPGHYQLSSDTPSACQGATMWIEAQLTFGTS